MRKKKLRKREDAGTSSSLGLEAAIHDSTKTSSSAPNGNVSGKTATAASGSSGDHGSRAARAERMAADAEVEAEDKKKRFNAALAKAGERANEKLADSFAKPTGHSAGVPRKVCGMLHFLLQVGKKG